MSRTEIQVGCKGTEEDWEIALGVKIQGESDLKQTEVLSRSKLAEHAKSYTVMRRSDTAINLRILQLKPETLAEHERSFPTQNLDRKRTLVEYDFQAYDNACKRQCNFHHEVKVSISDGDCGDLCLGCHVCHEQKTIEDEVDENDTCQSRPVTRKLNANALGVHIPDNSLHPADRRNAEVS